jgi:hypothetical protein
MCEVTIISCATSDNISIYDITTIACARSDYASIYDVTMITCSTSDDVLIPVFIIDVIYG